jgi:diaminopimelate decarboxylase
MDYFHYKNHRLFAEDVDLGRVAEECGTPCYVYSRATIERHWKAFDQAFGDHPHLVCYAVKANSNLAVLNLLARLGSGFDIVSVGELERVLAAGGQANKVVFSGVGKTADEMRRALDVGIRCFNVESQAELYLLERVAAEAGVPAPVSIRVNPDVDAKTHPYISTGLKDNKFGIAIDEVADVYQYISQSPHLKVQGVDCHIGSQLTEVSPFVDALDRVLALVDTLETQGVELHHIDLGGGLGIQYRAETPPLPEQQISAIRQRLAGRDIEILVEPGRAIVGNAGVLLTRVIYLKDNGDKHFAIVDAAMNDLMRPALYDAWQEIIPVVETSNEKERLYDVVGPVCETGDFLGKDRKLSITQGDRLAVRSAGAYGFTMSSNYNTRPRAAEVMVDGDHYHVVRSRETVTALFEDESVLPLDREQD